MAESCDATLNPRPALRPTASEAKAILDAQDCPPASNHEMGSSVDPSPATAATSTARSG